MNVALRKAMTLAEFLAWEERQPLRHEFDGVQPIAMTGGTVAHAGIQRNLATLSVQRYVFLSQHEVAGTMFERVGSDWIGHLLAAGGVLRMPEIGIEVPLAEFYDGIDFSPPAEDQPPGAGA